MTLVDELIELLDQDDPGRDDSGPGIDDGDEVEPIDWRVFAPPRREATRDGDFDWDIYGDDWAPDFPGEWIEAIDDALESGDVDVGTEAACGEEVGALHRCAWYVPLHMSSSSFGIYIREACVLERAVRIAGRLQGRRRTPTLAKALYRGAAFELFLHEQFHHKIESLGFRLLVVEGRTRYIDYDTNVYRKVLGTNDCLEEALANADAHRRLKEEAYESWIGRTIREAAQRALELSWRRSPPGYNQAHLYVGGVNNADGLSRLKAQVHEATVRPRRLLAWRLSPNFAESLFPITSNIYTVYPVGGKPLMPIR